jgi:hypothetical protein
VVPKKVAAFAFALLALRSSDWSARPRSPRAKGEGIRN